MVDEIFSYERFRAARANRISSLLCRLEEEIERRFQQIAEATNDESERIQLFQDACESVVDELVELGHRFASADYEPDIRFELNRQYFRPDIVGGELCGLELDLRPGRARLNWIVSSTRLKCRKCGRPPGRNVAKTCQYCGETVDCNEEMDDA